VEGVLRVLDRPAAKDPTWNSRTPDPGTSYAPWRIYNIGNSSPVELIDFISAIERELGKTAIKELLPLQPGDVPDTSTNVEDLFQQFGYKPNTPVENGIKQFISWYRDYYKV
jgi:UDP-glucuronate 4-epimerase